jgi:hypothetical protein
MSAKKNSDVLVSSFLVSLGEPTHKENLMKLILLFALLQISALAHASSHEYGLDLTTALDSDPIVPIVTGDSDVQKRAGLLYYDEGVGLKIINPTGTPETLSATGTSPVTTGGSSERVERAVVNCDGSSAIISQSGSWVSSIGNISAGACTVTLASGKFTSAPTCVASANSSSSPTVYLSAYVTSSTSVTIDCSADGTTDCSVYDANLICMGPR